MFEHAIKLLQDKAPTLTHAGRHDCHEAIGFLESVLQIAHDKEMPALSMMIVIDDVWIHVKRNDLSTIKDLG